MESYFPELSTHLKNLPTDHECGSQDEDIVVTAPRQLWPGDVSRLVEGPQTRKSQKGDKRSRIDFLQWAFRELA